ncbi:hypothetical protein CCUS01_17059 [Colletotrichum cuscutae]|uniref:Uncharacterized protein n=1 Tax=Colletotrichum cuscutae TaxID=1209917 RepID=A0AAI9Y589_9PEZI|nr:hypothetical protein CCUS01_17059 [Colletotrichum cuscutae]
MLADSVNRLRGANRQIGALHCADERAFSKSGRREGGGTTGGHRQAGSLPGKKQAASQDFPTDSFDPHTLLREPPVQLGSPAPTGGSIDRRLSNSNGRVGTQRSMIPGQESFCGVVIEKVPVYPEGSVRIFCCTRRDVAGNKAGEVQILYWSISMSMSMPPASAHHDSPGGTMFV